MALSDYFSFRNAVDPDTDGVGKVAAGLAEFERRTGCIAKSSDCLVWDKDGRVQRTPLL